MAGKYSLPHSKKVNKRIKLNFIERSKKLIPCSTAKCYSIGRSLSQKVFGAKQKESIDEEEEEEKNWLWKSEMMQIL